MFKSFIINQKKVIAIIAILCALAIAISSAIIIRNKKDDKKNDKKDDESSSSIVVESEPSSKEESSIEEEVSSIVSSSAPESVEQKPQSKPAGVTSSAPQKKPIASNPVVNNTDFKYNTNTDIDNNVFLDSLVYTGYNLKKHRADGLMWKYVLASQKRGKGWLSKIGYAGGSSGYETINGKPNIKAFERGGLVCASYVTYVYFNYLPNVAGINTSSLTRPVKSYSANDWYIAASDWVKKGYSKKISFKASKTSAGFINFKPASQIPIGSIMAFSDAKKPGSTHCSHVAIYAGYKNGYNWVFHVGNENGPEFCAVERMHFGPDPQWPLAVITTPSNIRMAAMLEVILKDDKGTALNGVKFTLKNTKTGAVKELGATNNSGKLLVEGLVYGDYTVTQTVPSGYTCAKATQNIKLTTANNSYNKINFVNVKLPEEIPSEETPSAEETLPPEQTEPSVPENTVE